MFQALKRVRGLLASRRSTASTSPMLSFKPSSGYAAWEPRPSRGASQEGARFQALTRGRGLGALNGLKLAHLNLNNVSSPLAGTRPASQRHTLHYQGKMTCFKPSRGYPAWEPR